MLVLDLLSSGGMANTQKQRVCWARLCKGQATHRHFLSPILNCWFFFFTFTWRSLFLVCVLEFFLVLGRNAWHVWTHQHSRLLAQWKEKLDTVSDMLPPFPATLVCVSGTANMKSMSLKWSCDLISECLWIVDGMLWTKEQEVSLDRAMMMLQTPHTRKLSLPG